MTVPATLGELVIRERLGEGGYGTVYRAEQPSLGRDAVVKVLHARVSAGPQAERFLAEVRLAARLDHPYAAHVYAFGVEPDGLAWVAMERVRGTPLDRLLATTGPLPPERLLPLVDRLCEVVQSAHEQGIVHRDLKPANVMVLSRAGRLLPKLLDLGVARAEGEAAQQGGTPLYMAPEQWTSPDGVDGRADVYALGVLVFECLTGRTPFTGASWFAVAKAHAKKPPPPLGPGFPPALDAVVARALAKRREDRFATAGELAAALRSAAGLVDDRARPPRLREDVRVAFLERAPQPLAESIAALDAAQNPHQAGLAARTVVSTAARWVGVLGLASTGRTAGRVPPLARELARRPLDDAEWLTLSREATAPFTEHPEAAPVPELVGLTAAPPVLDLAAPTEEELRAALAAHLERVATFLAALEPLLGYTLVVARKGRAEVWSGLRRSPRTTVATPSLPDGEPVLVDAEGAPVLRLLPLVVVAPPAPGAAEEVFVVAGPGRHGARMVASPSGFERQDEEPFTWLRRGLDEASRAQAAAESERAPYLGLAAFTAGEADVYFGREREAQAFVNRLRVTSLLAVIGPSGAGKSSFVAAGVVPILPPGWRVVTLRPGPKPLAALEARLEGAPELLVVDQLEELFTLGASPDERRAFATRLAALAGETTHVVVTLRDDFLMRAQALPELGDRLAQGLVLLATPGEDDLKRIVVEPARRAGYDFDDPELPSEMAHAVAERPGALPLLSFTAARLWEQRDRHFRRLQRRAYEAIGGVGGALAAHAEQTLAGLPPEEQALVRQAFRRLVTAEGTRAVVGRADLLHVLGPRGERVLERLVNARLLTATESDAGDERVEVVHEALLDAWPRLAAWRREDASGARLRGQLGDAARQWEERGRPHGLLWRDEALADLQRWRREVAEPLTRSEDAFASASVADATRGRRRRRMLLGGAFAVLAAGVVVLAQMNARTAAERRVAQGRLAELYEEQGRQAVLAAQPQQALVYLAEAQRLGAVTAAGRFLVAASLKMMDAEVADLGGHKGPVWRVAFSPDGGRVVTAGDDGTARVFDLHGVTLAVLHHEGPVWTASFSPDGGRVATASWDGTAGVWDAASGARLATLRHKDKVYAAAWNPDGKRLLTSTRDGALTIWDIDTARATPLVESGPRMQDAVWTPDGTTAVGGDTENRFHIWTGGAVRTVQAPVISDRSLIWSLTASRDGKRVVAASHDGTVTVVDTVTASIVAHIGGHLDKVWSAELDPAGEMLLTASDDGTAKLWQLGALDRPVASLAHPGQVVWATFSPDGRLIATAGGDGVLRIFDRGGVLLAQRSSGRDALQHVAFDPGGKLVATATYGGSGKIWHALPLDLLAERETGAHRACVARFSPDGTRVATIGQGDQTVRLWQAAGLVAQGELPGAVPASPYLIVWDPSGDRVLRGRSDGAEIVQLDGTPVARLDTQPVWDGQFFSGSERVATAGDEGLIVWEARTGRRLSHPTSFPTTCLTLDADASRAFLCGIDGAVTVVDLKGGSVEARLPSSSLRMSSIAVNSSGSLMVVAGDESVAKVWSVPERRVLRTLEGHGGPISDAQLSPDGDLIATASTDRTVRIWDSRTGRMLRVLEHPDQLNSVQFSPDGHKLLTASSFQGILREWDVQLDQHSPTDLGHLAECRVPLRLVEGRALPISVDNKISPQVDCREHYEPGTRSK